jgi:hypothetical protein
VSLTPLFEVDPEMASLDLDSLRGLIGDEGRGVAYRGRALMELGRRTSTLLELLPEVSGYVREEANSTAVVIGTITVSQMGLAGLVASRSAESIREAEGLAREAGPHAAADLHWLVVALGGTWPPAAP